MDSEEIIRPLVILVIMSGIFISISCIISGLFAWYLRVYSEKKLKSKIKICCNFESEILKIFHSTVLIAESIKSGQIHTC